MNFKMSLEHTENEEWQQLREENWAGIRRRTFATNATEKDLKPYRDYFFFGDIEKAIGNGGYTDFATMLFWSPANSLEDLKKVFAYYWEWFFSAEENIKIYQGYGIDSAEKYLNAIVLEIAGWTYYQPPKLTAELFLWIYGDSYDKNRIFPIPLGADNWQPQISVDEHLLAFRLLRGVRDYLFSDKKKTSN